jgi:hypothetical protein
MTDKEAMVASLLRDALLMIGSPFSMGKIMSFHAGTLNGQASPAMLSKALRRDHPCSPTQRVAW